MKSSRRLQGSQDGSKTGVRMRTGRDIGPHRAPSKGQERTQPLREPRQSPPRHGSPRRLELGLPAPRTDRKSVFNHPVCGILLQESRAG